MPSLESNVKLYIVCSIKAFCRLSVFISTTYQVASGSIELPSHKPQSKSKPPQSKPKAAQSKSKPQVKPKGKAKGRRKSTVNLPTLPPFDFEGYLREKDNRKFQLLIDQPQKCHMEGGRGEALYMLIAVKSVAADFDKRQVNMPSFMFMIYVWPTTA